MNAIQTTGKGLAMIRTGLGSTPLRTGPGRGGRRNNHNTLDLLYGAFMICGIAVGVILLTTVDQSYKQQLLDVVGGYVTHRSGQSFAATVGSACTMNILLVMLLMFCGYCSVSLPLIGCIAAFKGLGYGVSTAMVYSIYGIQALPYVNLLILPNALFSSLVIINSCREATLNASGQWGRAEQSREQIKDFNFKIFRNIVILLLAGLLEALLFFTIGRFLTL